MIAFDIGLDCSLAMEKAPKNILTELAIHSRIADEYSPDTIYHWRGEYGRSSIFHIFSYQIHELLELKHKRSCSVGQKERSVELSEEFLNIDNEFEIVAIEVVSFNFSPQAHIALHIFRTSRFKRRRFSALGRSTATHYRVGFNLKI